MAILTATAAPQLDPQAARWVTSTLEGMTLDQKVGQLIMPSFRSTYLSSDSDGYDALVSRVHEQHVGGFLLFGGREPAPDVLLNAGYSRSVLGQPLAAASITNRLQSISALPLLNSADFEAGVGFRIGRATTFPRAMAFGAAGDDRLAFEAGRITALEARALGIHVNFAPVADVNNNPRNPVINTRSFGEDPAMVARLAAAYVRGFDRWRHDRHRQALPGSRRHRCRLASRAAAHRRIRARGSTGSSCRRFAPASPPARRRS